MKRIKELIYWFRNRYTYGGGYYYRVKDGKIIRIAR